MKVPAFDLTRQYSVIGAEIESAVSEVMAKGHFILGDHVAQLEEEVARYIGVRYAIGVANGSDALHLALMALGIGIGDEVIVPAFTFFATGGAVARTGATPVFADVDPVSYNLDPVSFEGAITSRTKAVIPVHLYGNPANMSLIKSIAQKHDIRIIEDCAQAIGAAVGSDRVGTFGDFGTLSFFPTKNLGAFGDGGMVVTNDAELAASVRMLRVHGAKRKYYHESLGYNSRLDELQAAVLRVKLHYLSLWTERRQHHARRYAELLAASPVAVPEVGMGTVHVFHQYTVRTTARDRLQKYLAEQGIGSTVYYPTPLHRQPVFEATAGSVSLPVSERCAQEVLSLPLFPELTDEEILYVTEHVKQFFC